MSHSDHTLISASDLSRFTSNVLEVVGMSPEDAAVSADAMVWGDLRGLSHHGVAVKLPNCVDRILAGGTNPRASLSIMNDSGAFTAFNGNTGWGQVLATRAMWHVIERARMQGIAAAVIQNASSAAALGYYPMLAVEAEMIGMAISNAVAALAPPGGTRGYLGNQPHAIASPARRHQPVLFDSASSMISTGAIHDLLEQGETLPEGVSLTADGEPTIDPATALRGLHVASGGHRGSGLALMWEILTGVLAGGIMAPHVGAPGALTTPQGVSLFLLAIDPTVVMPLDDFLERVDTLIDGLIAVPVRQGAAPVRAPGSRGHALAAERRINGIPVSGHQVQALQALAGRVGAPAL